MQSMQSGMLTALPAKPSKQGLSVHFQRSTRVEHEAPATTHAISNMSTQHVTQRRMCWLQGTDRPGKYNLRRPPHHRQSASCLQSMSLRGECAGYRAQTGQASRKSDTRHHTGVQQHAYTACHSKRQVWATGHRQGRQAVKGFVSMTRTHQVGACSLESMRLAILVLVDSHFVDSLLDDVACS